MSEDNKDFKVEDKRSYVRDESGDFVKRKNESPETQPSSGEEPPQEKPQESPGKEEQQIPLPELNFPTFILSLHTSGLVHLGELPDPHAPEAQRDPNLSLAKQTIDLVAMLKEKTKGNLNDHETQLIDQVLFELRMKFVQAKKGTKSN